MDEHLILPRELKVGKHIYRLDPDRPVYRLGEGPLPFEPTGRLFVRLGTRQRLADAREIFDEIGLTIEEINAWAPQSGWLVDTGGSVAGALGRLATLQERLGGEASVEPEWLSPRRRLDR